MFSLFFSPILYVLKLVIPAWFIIRTLRVLYLSYNHHAVDIKKEGLLFLLTVYASSAMAVTIAPASISGFNDPGSLRLNLVPIVNTAIYYINASHDHDDYAKLHALENIIGNLILLIPLGILLPCIFRSARSLTSVLTSCVVFSFSIELIQFFLRQIGTFRTVDIDDLIMNTIGGMVGWFIYSKIIQRFFPVLILM